MTIASRKYLTCDEHPDAEIMEDYRIGEMSCSKCGTILLDYMPSIPETCRVIDINDGIEENSLSSNSTYIFSGPNFRGSQTNHINKEEKVNNSDNTLEAVYSRIEIIAKKLDGNQEEIDIAKDTCKELYMKNPEMLWLPDTLAGVCLFDTFLKREILNTVKKIHLVSNTISHFEILICYEKIAEDRTSGLYYTKIKTEDYITQFCENLGLPKEVLNVALHIATQAKPFIDIPSLSSDAIAAAAIYMATQVMPEYHTDINEVADKCCIAASIITKVYEDLKNISHRLFFEI